MNATECPNCGTGHVVWNGEPSDFYFTCTSCEWECGRGGAHPGGGLKGLVGVALYGGRVPKEKPKKKHKPESDPVEFVEDSDDFKRELRAVVARRMFLLKKERAKFPPTNIVRKGKLVPNPDFTEQMREHMHRFAVDVIQVREELLKS